MNDYRKMRAIPDNILGPALQNHARTLRNVVTWIDAHEKAQRRRDRLAVLVAVGLFVLIMGLAV